MSCAARIPDVCGGSATEAHHRKLRRSRDESYVNRLPVCAPCHRHIHANPAWARSWGLIVPQHLDPADIHPHIYPNPNDLGPEPREETS